MIESELKLLALCTRFDTPPLFLKQLKTAAAQFTTWGNLPTLAEQHGLAPLTYFHLKNIPDAVPPLTLRTLRGQALRDRLINQVRTAQVAAIGAAFEHASLPILFLKGAALAHMLYPEPGLRPMSDLDLLVSRQDLTQAYDLLQDLGYHGAVYGNDIEKSRHLPPINQEINGFSIGIELHYALLQDSNGRPWFEMNNLTSAPLSFQLPAAGCALSLGREDMLFHLCQHAFFNNSGFDSMRLMWVADIVNFANRFAAEINWQKVRRCYPSVLHALTLLHPISPLSDEVISCANLQPATSPAAVGMDFQGWPVLPVHLWQQKGYKRVVEDTLFPSPWWLRLPRLS